PPGVRPALVPPRPVPSRAAYAAENRGDQRHAARAARPPIGPANCLATRVERADNPWQRRPILLGSPMETSSDVRRTSALARQNVRGLAYWPGRSDPGAYHRAPPQRRDARDPLSPSIDANP